ncbi:hypothetical protein [Glaciimonas sp. PCH181]|nr:hypothetical protein [Glaciimonas sp. PCH181]
MTMGVWFGVTRDWISSGKNAEKTPNLDEKGGWEKVEKTLKRRTPPAAI